MRSLWLTLGLVLVGVGFVGLFVPLLPTIDFLLLALPCFAKSSPRLEGWLLNHKRFGPPIRAWQAERAVPMHAKIFACVGMSLGYTSFCLVAHPRWPIAASIAGLLIATCIWIVRRPAPSETVGEKPTQTI
ncbi:YbaN family protein [Sphingomonas gei]|uniref:YbaN family protein n=1 Tax=Sphingomonas gei TaxID=1395960 RepID=UPI0030B889E4